MGSFGASGNRVESSPIRDRREATRRALLAKAGLLAGAAGLAAAATAGDALATHLPGQQPQPEDFDGYYNIKHFGAVPAPSGNPVANRTAIQTCLDTAAADQKVCYIPPGVWEIDVPGNTTEQTGVNVPDNSIVRGVGPASVIKYLSLNTKIVDSMGMLVAAPGRGPAMRATALSAAKNILIEDIKVDRTLGTHQPSARCMYFPGGERIFIRHVECVGQVSSGIGIQMGAKFSAVEDCYVHNQGKDGIAIYGAEDAVIRGNLIVECGDDHIAAVGTRVAVVDNICDAGAGPNADPGQLGAAIAFRGGHQVTVAGNLVRGGYRGAIEFENRAEIQDIDIVGNVIVEAGNGGRLESVPGAGGGSAIVLRGHSDLKFERINIQGNLISAPRFHGIYVIQETYALPGSVIGDVAIADNQIWINPAAPYRAGDGCGIFCYANFPITDFRIVGNSVRSSVGPGIQVTGIDSGGTLTTRRFDVSGNRVTGAGGGLGTQSGILLDRIEDLTVTGNRSYGQDTGLFLANPRGSVIVTQNDVNGNVSSNFVYQAGTPGPDRLRVRDNPGLSPWTGRVTITGGWSGANPFVKESTVIAFGVPFPPGKPPRVHVRGEDVDAAGVATTVTETGFKARLVASANLGSGSHKAVWVAEPDDNSNGD
jgi:hypothetical protein